MNTHAYITQGNKSQAAANDFSQKQSSRKTPFHFVDNRPETIAERKMKEMANYRPQVKQLRPYQEITNNSNQTNQFTQRPADRNLKRIVIQRRLDLSKVTGDYSLLARAINIFSEIESDDITMEEFNVLKTERQRFIPLFGRFSLARNTTLVVSPAPKKVAGDMAITRLSCTTVSQSEYDYDDNNEAFMRSMGEKSIISFTIKVLFWAPRVFGQESQEEVSYKNVGTILQAFNHEMSVHAENMLDFTEDYWTYYNGEGVPPPNLGTPSEEHAAFKQGTVKRYEYMSARIKKMGGKIAADYERREVADKFNC